MQKTSLDSDIILIGAGIMSATLATFLKELEPDLTIHIYERLSAVGLESSNTLNNAGTGHAGMCELHYNPELADGTVDVTKSNNIMEPFEISKQFWAYLVEQNILSSDKKFIHAVPHMSAVFGENNVRYLRKRYETIQDYHLFHGMEYSEDPSEIVSRAPLLVNERDKKQSIAATRMHIGTDVNFGALTRGLFDSLTTHENVHLHLRHEVRDLQQDKEGIRQITVKDLNNNTIKTIRTGFVFVGAGGQAIPLLDKSGIPEAKQFSGFPVGAQWLICTNPDIVKQHHAKVYGRPSVDAPPMSVAHLDTRIIDGKKALMFGPYAEFTTKFLKKGSVFDLFRSLRWYTIIPLIQVGLRNLSLTKYLIKQSLQSQKDRMTALRNYMPSARDEDWKLAYAGKRVQIIKNDPEKGGVLQFGTEVVVSQDKTLTALLGASPGASTGTSIMLELLERAFPEKMKTSARQKKIIQMIPSHGKSLADDSGLAYTIRSRSHKVLGLHPVEETSVPFIPQPGIRRAIVQPQSV